MANDSVTTTPLTRGTASEMVNDPYTSCYHIVLVHKQRDHAARVHLQVPRALRVPAAKSTASRESGDTANQRLTPKLRRATHLAKDRRWSVKSRPFSLAAISTRHAVGANVPHREHATSSVDSSKRGGTPHTHQVGYQSPKIHARPLMCPLCLDWRRQDGYWQHLTLHRDYHRLEHEQLRARR